jgi:membrane-associated phospholipid phosphatase
LTDKRTPPRRLCDGLARWTRSVKALYRWPELPRHSIPIAVLLLGLLIVTVDPLSVRLFTWIAAADDWFGETFLRLERGPLALIANALTALFLSVSVLLIGLGLWSFGAIRQDRYLTRFVAVAGRIAILQSTATEAIKLIAGRARPDALFRPDGSWHDWWHPLTYGGSFPSGHAAFTCALAVIGAAYWPKARASWIAMAIAVSLARCLLIRHNISDVVAGAAIGWWLGALVLSAYPPLPRAVLARLGSARRTQGAPGDGLRT